MIRVGIGGWTYAPWRETFYPADLPKARELGFASRRVTAIEVNGTFYRTQTPATFRRWREETPEGFAFTLKAPRYVVTRRTLAEAGDGIARFLESGITELGDRLGAILWQLPPTHSFDAADIAAFLALLPRRQDGLPLRHALEVRHASFADPAFVALVRQAGATIVHADSETHPLIADAAGDIAYLRLRRAVAGEPAGYPPEALDVWAKRTAIWAEGGTPADLPLLTDPAPAPERGRDVFVFFINGAKERAPAAAQALLQRLSQA